MKKAISIELLKLRTTPAAAVTVALVGVLTAASAVTTILLAGHKTAPLGSSSNVSHALAVGATTSVAMLILGIVISAGEDRHRTALGTYLADPRRERVLVAKLLTGGLGGAALGAFAYALALLVALPLYLAKGVHHFHVPLVGLGAGSVLGAACFGMLGVAIGALTRNTVVSIVGSLVWVGIIELGLLSQALPSVARWLPAAASKSITSAGQETVHLLAPSVAALVIVGWAAGLAVLAWAVTLRREVR